MTDSAPLEKLASPPIVEVICGVFFEGLPNLDPVVAGTYWNERKDEYPGHSVHPAAGSGPGLIFGGGGAPPLRTWLVSDGDGPFVIQIQADRFYLNWRRRGGAYPRFSTAEGLRERALREFERFSDFCESALGDRPRPAAVELGKIDHLTQGKHWSDKADLGDLLPTLQATLTFTQTDAPEILLRLRESREDHSLAVTLASARIGNANTVRLETTVVQPVDGELRGAFEKANRQANQVFAALIPEGQRQRFQERKGES